MECEICGEKSGILYEVIFQGRRVYACKKCIERYGLSVVRRKSNAASKRKYLMKRKTILKKNLLPESTEEIVEGYGDIIKRARERLGLTQEDIARELKVKLSYIKKVENEKIEPSLDIARRLEKLLNISLLTEVKNEETYAVKSEYMEESLTLGDLLDFEEEE